MKWNFPIIILLFFSLPVLQGQNKVLQQKNVGLTEDKCGFLPDSLMLKKTIANWGYGYHDLIHDLNNWVASPFVKLESLGLTNLNHALYVLSISNRELPDEGKISISIHARTHPAEVQSTYVTNQIISFLLSDNPTAVLLRNHGIFYIMPMLNPDGVELNLPRENANNIDLESNWSAEEMEFETSVLQSFFENKMYSGNPLKIALNIHSAYACKRYFVYHHEAGTSPVFAQKEKLFINSIKKYWPEGFEDWWYYVSWENGTPDYYPESWFWNNFQENVMALTYEDMNCDQAGEYAKTANSILNGIADYLELRPVGTHPVFATKQSKLFPNPTSPNHIVHINSSEKPKQIFITEITTGKKTEIADVDRNQFRAPFVAAGLYAVTLIFENEIAQDILIVQ